MTGLGRARAAAVLTLFIATGCTHTLERVPPPEAFEHTIPEVLDEYPEAASISPDYSESGDPSMSATPRP